MDAVKATVDDSHSKVPIEGKTIEDLAAVMRELAASVAGVKSTVDDSLTILKDLVASKPHVDGERLEMRADINPQGRHRCTAVDPWLKSKEQRVVLPENPTPTASTCKDNNIDIDAVYGADDAFQTIPEQGEAVPFTTSTLLEVKATQLLNPFIVLDLDALVPAKCSAECLVNDIASITQMYNVVSNEKVEVEVLAMADIISVDPGDHRQPPWLQPQVCTIRCSCWGISNMSQTEMKPWRGEAQYPCTGVCILGHHFVRICRFMSYRKSWFRLLALTCNNVALMV